MGPAASSHLFPDSDRLDWARNVDEVSYPLPGADRAKFLEVANGAKAGCPISRLLKAEITMDATLEG
jgi:osmotically inducible protein OsmC